MLHDRLASPWLLEDPMTKAAKGEQLCIAGTCMASKFLPDTNPPGVQMRQHFC